jgi:hypothetical protein
VLVLVIWNVLSVSGIVSQRLFPSPLTVLEAFWDLIVTGQLKSALAVFLARGVTGMVIGATLGIAGGTRTVFDNPDNVYGFTSKINHNDFFNGRSPLEILSQGDMISLYETFRGINALRSAQW